MLTKYNLIHVPSGGVDHLLDGVRIRIDHRLTNHQADQLKALGLPYFQEIIRPKTTTSQNGKASPKPKTAKSAKSAKISPNPES